LFIVSALILEKMTLTQGPLIGTRVPHGGYEQEIWGHMMYNCVGGKAVDTTFRPLNSWNARFGDVPADRLALLKKFWNNDGDRSGIAEEVKLPGCSLFQPICFAFLDLYVLC
jgi:hypothetical protein